MYVLCATARSAGFNLSFGCDVMQSLSTKTKMVELVTYLLPQVYGYTDKDRIVRETSYYSLGFVGLAVLAFVANIVAVSESLYGVWWWWWWCVCVCVVKLNLL